MTDKTVQVVPCEWVKKQYQALGCRARIEVWPVGIDTVSWNTCFRKKPQFDALIYYKNVTKQRSEADIQRCLQVFSLHNQTYRVIKYGSYVEAEYQELLATCRYMITIAGTESQFISQLEAFAMGIPAYILDVNTMLYNGIEYRGQGYTTAPYFDRRCGILHPDYAKFEEFLKNVDTYDPRQYVLDNLTMDACAERYCQILRTTQ
jgi:hypothetical protein